MATRDRSQGIAFIYANPVHLMRSFGLNAPQATSVRVQRPDVLPMGVLDAERAKAVDESIGRLKSNLSRLEEMQSKVRFMIHELEQSSRGKR